MRQIGVGTWKCTPLAKELVNEVLGSGRLSYGPMCRRLERDFAGLHGARFGVLSNSGTSSLQVALQAMKELHGWRDGDEVLIPAVTFVATANIVLHNKMRPVLVDVESEYYGMSWTSYIDTLSALDCPRAVIPVHLFGQPCHPAIYQEPCFWGGKVIEDSCETMFVKSTHNLPTITRSVGSMSDIACFSMYIAHLLTAGVGGLSITNNPDYAAKMRSLVNHGRDGIYVSIDDDRQYNKEVVSRRFNFESVGHSFRITEMEAAIALAGLADHKSMIEKRQHNAAVLSLALAPLEPRLQLPKIRPHTEHAFMMYPIVMRDEDKWPLCHHLEQHSVETRELMRLTDQPVYRGMWNPKDYPVAEWINRGGFYCGIHQDLTRDDIEYIAEKIHEWCKSN